jgi:hypothetical protein
MVEPWEQCSSARTGNETHAHKKRDQRRTCMHLLGNKPLGVSIRGTRQRNREAFIQRRRCTEVLLHTQVFTHRNFDTEMLLHATFCSLQTAAAPYFLSQSGQECVSFTQGPCRWQWTCYTSRLCTSGGRCQTSPRGSTG